MKIIHLCKNSPSDSYGGVEVVVDHLATHQAASGHDVEVITASKRGCQINSSGYRVTMVKPSWLIYPTFPFSLNLLHKVISRIHRADIVHVHFPNPSSDLALLLSRWNKSIVVTYHADIIRHKLLLYIYHPLMMFLLRKADCIVATSQIYLATSPILGKFKQKVKVVPIGIPDQNPTHRVNHPRSWYVKKKRQSSRDSVYFLFVGAFRYYKCLDVLLEAAVNVAAGIVIVGDGPYRAALKKKVEKLELRNIRFTGIVSDEEKLWYYDNAYAVILPSCVRSEAFGITLIEGSMFGLPLISCKLGSGNSFINIDQQTGLVCPPKDPAAITNAMNRLIADPSLARRFGKQARKRFETLFTVEKMTAGYDEVYAKLPALTGSVTSISHPSN